MAIVGDSGTTGAASSPNLEPMFGNIWDHFWSAVRNPRVQTELPLLAEFPASERWHFDSVQPLTRVPYSRQEYEDEGNFVSRFFLNQSVKVFSKLDVPEHAFGYMVGRGLGIKPSDIVLVGQDGVMVETIPAQFGRIYEMKTKTLPPLVLVSYTANDLCDERVIDEPLEKWAGRFKANLGEAWIAAEPYLKAHPRGTHIVVLAPLDVVNVITNPEVLSQTTNVEGEGQMTCAEVRRGLTSWAPTAWIVSRMLTRMCPSVTETHVNDTERLTRLKDLQLAFNEAWKSEIQELNAQYASKNIRWSYLESARDLHFAKGDVGNDCFHPSVRGHAKLADLILQSGELQ